jgi:hypothetical protein
LPAAKWAEAHIPAPRACRSTRTHRRYIGNGIDVPAPRWPIAQAKTVLALQVFSLTPVKDRRLVAI